MFGTCRPWRAALFEPRAPPAQIRWAELVSLAPELESVCLVAAALEINFFGAVDSQAAIIMMLTQGMRSSRFWPLPDIRAPGEEQIGLQQITPSVLL